MFTIKRVNLEDKDSFWVIPTKKNSLYDVPRNNNLPYFFDIVRTFVFS